MTLQRWGNSGKYLNEEYHETRKEARKSLGIYEWGDIEISRYDLDNIDFDRTMRVRPVTNPNFDAEGGPKSGSDNSDPVRD